MLGAITLLMTLSAAPLATADDPIDLAGTWSWEWKDEEGETHKHLLEVKRDPTGYVAVERFDDEPPVPVKTLNRDGKSLEFEVIRGNRTSSYKGKFVDADTIQGEVTVQAGGTTNMYAWIAKRVDVQEDPRP